MPILYSGKDYLALPREPQPWLVKKLVPVSGLVNMYGKPKTRKSWAALGLAEAISNRERTNWNGLPVLKHGPVVYIQADTPREEWAGRVDRLARFGYDISNIYFADGLTIPVYPLNVLDAKQVETFQQVIADVKPVLTVIDTLRESFRGDENSSDIMQGVISNIVRMTRPSAVLFVSHQRKDGLMSKERLEEDLMDDSRGSGYTSGRMDNVIRVTENRITVKGRAVKQTYWSIEEAPEDFDEDDPDAPPPMIVFKDDGRELLEATLRSVLEEQPAISATAAAKLLVEKKATELSEDHLRKKVLPKLLRKLQPKLVRMPEAA